MWFQSLTCQLFLPREQPACCDLISGFTHVLGLSYELSCISLTLSIFYVLIAYCLFVYVPWKNVCSYQLSSYRLGHLSFFTVNL